MSGELPLLYLITGGTAADQNFEADRLHILNLIRAGVENDFSLVQIREKQLSARAVYNLTRQAVELTKHSRTKLLVNDRADIARAAGADGVHLTGSSLQAATIRQTFGNNFIIGVSAHSLAEAVQARDDADFATFSPIFATPSKIHYGAPQGIERLRAVCTTLSDFPIIALGGINENNFVETLRAGAAGIAAISLFSDVDTLPHVVTTIRNAQRTRN